MIGTGRIARRGPDPLIRLIDQRLIVQRLPGRVPPVLAPHGLVQPLRQRLGQPIGKRLEENRVVVVVRRLVRCHPRVDAVPGRHGEGTDPVAHARLERGDKVGQRHVRPTVCLGHLLADGMDGGRALTTSPGFR